jgi:ABC-type transport system involved in cytochrome bd biosynthesis fused ATPase/permease subunit
MSNDHQRDENSEVVRGRPGRRSVEERRSAVMELLAARGVTAEQMTVGDLVALNAFLIQLFIPLGFRGTIYSMLKSASVDLERLFTLLHRRPEIVDRPGATALRVAGGHVRFDDVTFAYEPERPLLRGVSFDIPARRTIAIVGCARRRDPERSTGCRDALAQGLRRPDGAGAIRRGGQRGVGGR